MSDIQRPRPVRMLSQDVIHRIAAGEVVDRPASALKELLENSIDAGSTDIRVTVVDGGIRCLSVEDNGWGMTPEDLEVSVQRHATSKISTLDDLDGLLSLGFRGEALSAVSSVAKLKIETHREEKGPWVLEVTGSVKSPLKPGTRKRGTKVIIEDLFFNVPARRKFLKRPATEAAECVAVITSIAMAHPNVAFQWHIVDVHGELKEQETLPIQDARSRFLAICGVRGNPVEVDTTEKLPEGVARLHILALAPPAAQKSQKSIYLIVNGRVAQDKRLPFALREAYSGLIEVGHYPVVWVSIEVNPRLIDVNIHPQKKEIRWPADFQLASLVYSAVRPAFQVASTWSSSSQQSDVANAPSLFASRPAELLDSWKPVPSGSFTSMNMHTEDIYSDRRTEASVEFISPMASVPRQNTSNQLTPGFKFSDLKVIGECGAAWILCESPDGLILIDQHAAHERVEFEKFMTSKTLVESKPLFLSVDVPIPLYLQDRRAELIATLESVGFEVADTTSTNSIEKGSQVLELIAVPQAPRSLEWESVLKDVFVQLQDPDSLVNVAEQIKVRLCASLACHGSVRRGQRLDSQSIRALLNQMDAISWGAFCPHGRPVWRLLSHRDIEGWFHR